MNYFNLAAILLSAASLQAQPHSHQAHHGGHGGFLGSYPMSRDASGTAWQPDSSLMKGYHFMLENWALMSHGYLQGVYNRQGGPRGDTELYTNSMWMLMGQRPLGRGALGLRGMFSLDAIHGRDGYPLLFQTGETADGVNPLIDRQHPHDFFMELAGTYSWPVENGSAFIYLGMPGEPALGPPAFMHRFSGIDIPEAPIPHHWIDSTHITFGVATLGYVWENWKAEGSLFTGREPDRHRWNFDRPKFDSQSARLSYNPTLNWSFQASFGNLTSPEQLEPHEDVKRLTASAIRNARLSWGLLQTTLAFGRNSSHSDETDAWLLESSLRVYEKHTLMGRWERVDKNELFPGSHASFGVTKLSAGYLLEDLYSFSQTQWGAGVLGSVYRFPGALNRFYGDNPASFILFIRGKII